MHRIIFFGAALWSASFGIPKKYACPFCDPFVWKQQQFYEDDLIRGLNDYRPVSESHKLIIPKRHISRFENLTDAELLAIKRLINQIKTPHYLILQKITCFSLFHMCIFILFQKIKISPI